MNKKLFGVVFLTTLFFLSSQVSACSTTANGDIEIMFDGGIGYMVTVINHKDYEIEANLFVERIGLRPRPLENATWTIPPGYGFGHGRKVLSFITFIKATVTVEDIVAEKTGVIIGIFVIFSR